MLSILSLLSPKSASTEVGGGEATLTPELVVAACSGLSRHAYLYARLKYALDETVAFELLKLTTERAWRKSRRYKWRLASGEGKRTIHRLAYLTLKESIQDRRCRTCRGNGEVKYKLCVVCNGTGNGRELSEDYLAAALEVSLRRVRFFWRDKYRGLRSDLQATDQMISEHIFRHLSDDQ